jgi:hypothetical protein
MVMQRNQRHLLARSPNFFKPDTPARDGLYLIEFLIGQIGPLVQNIHRQLNHAGIDEQHPGTKLLQLGALYFMPVEKQRIKRRLTVCTTSSSLPSPRP